MPKKLTQEEFIARAKAVHGDKYDYSKVEYKNSSSFVKIICPIHGEFENIAMNHLLGFGCPKCSNERRKSLVAGVGINNVHGSTETACYDIWAAMLKRCYDPKAQAKNPTYKGCSVCKDWHTLSNFKKWYDENYIEGYDIDKDILVKDNKVYSPETCCFVPHDLNSHIAYKRKHKYYSGVCYDKRRCRYKVSMTLNAKSKTTGYYATAEEAFMEYKRMKETYIKQLATSYYERGEISEKIYNAFMRYEIEDELTPQK